MRYQFQLRHISVLSFSLVVEPLFLNLFAVVDASKLGTIAVSNLHFLKKVYSLKKKFLLAFFLFVQDI